MSYKKAVLVSISIMAIFSSAVLAESHPEKLEADVVVYGATPGGISAAAANGRLYICTADGTVTCFGAK